jgi:hypothetical protein
MTKKEWDKIQSETYVGRCKLIKQLWIEIIVLMGRALKVDKILDFFVKGN